MSTHDPVISTKATCNRRTPPKFSSRKLTAFYFFILTVVFMCGRHLLPRPPSVYNNSNNTKSSAPSTTEITTTNTNSDSTTITIPPLKDLIDKNGKVISDISWMLDFAIIGFPKSGTSFLKNYLNQTEETFVYHREFCIKKSSDLTRFVEVYHELHVRFQQQQQVQHNNNNNQRIRFGLKCPGVLYRSHDMNIYKTYFPNTKFIVGIRHPVIWFESFYNYQVGRNVSLPASTSSLIGKCENHQKVCTDRARFHAALARLRKTPLVEKEEVDLLFGTRYEGNYNNTSSLHPPQQLRRFLNSGKHKKQQDGFPNQLLLYEVRQLHQNDTTPRELSETLRNYLDIQSDLPPILSYKNIKPRAINICDDVHANVRRLLVDHGTDAAIWIKDYLMENPTVEIASPESFVRLLDSWSADPCATAS